jgi:antitoxin (DNA-binding transcriptional repressor) of toxin-antitoxin stability system
MLKNLRESKAKLSELVERASQGEDVLITVRGKIKARLTRAGMPQPGVDGKSWARRLRTLHGTYSKSHPKISIEQILDEQREERG